MEARDLYLKHTDKEGRSHVQQHRVWDASLFVQTQDRAARELGGKAAIELSTEEDYKKALRR